jgi:hypothetical protein
MQFIPLRSKEKQSFAFQSNELILSDRVTTRRLPVLSGSHWIGSVQFNDRYVRPTIHGCEFSTITQFSRDDEGPGRWRWTCWEPYLLGDDTMHCEIQRVIFAELVERLFDGRDFVPMILQMLFGTGTDGYQGIDIHLLIAACVDDDDS